MMRFVELRTAGTLSIAGFTAIAFCLCAGSSPASAQEGQRGQIHAQKVCPAATFTGAPGSYCTITVSDIAAIPANETRVYYDEPLALPIGAVAFLDSKVVIYAGRGNWA